MVRFMKALVARNFGGPEVLAVEEVAIPEPGPGQILVRIAAAGLNPADLRGLDGPLREYVGLTLPHIPGSDFAGTVTRTGPGVTRFVPGDEVFGLGLPGSLAPTVSDPPSPTTGTMAEYALFQANTPAIDHRPTAPPPGSVATSPIAGPAAEGAAGVPVARLAAGGAAGVSVARLAAGGAAGVSVAGLAAGGAVGLGAGEVIDYRAVDTVEETLRRYLGGVAAVVNLAMPGDRLFEAGRVVRPGGQVLNIAFPKPDPADFDVPVETVFTRARPGDLREVAARLPVVPARRYRLEEAAQAYADLIGTHVRGKLVVLMQ